MGLSEERPDIQEELDHVRSTGDSVLSLNYKGLHSFPSLLETDYRDFQHVSRIYVKENLLKSLPSNIVLLQGLVEIYAPQNEISCIPHSFGDLHGLQSLDLSHNKLRELPPCVGRLRSLEKLRVSNNKITALPPELGCLQNLRTLEVMNNCIRSIPVELSHCQQLTRLLLDRNQLTWLPGQLCQLPRLEELSVSGNQLLCLPLDLGHMRTLRAVYVDNNPYLHAIPVSLTHQEIGFNSSGRSNYEPSCDSQHRWQHITVKLDGENKRLYLPREITGMCDKDTNRVQSLTEKSLRVLHSHRSYIDPGPEDLPRHLLDRLDYPTASCQVCRRPIFSTAFPMVFEGQIRIYRLCRLALCCSTSCVHIASLSVNLPLLYPNPTNLYMAVALIDDNAVEEDGNFDNEDIEIDHNDGHVHIEDEEHDFLLPPE